MADEQPKCELCGEPMPPGEQMFKYHGYSGPCPKPPLPKDQPPKADAPIGTPISQLSGRPGHPGYARFCEIAASWGYD